MKGNREDTPAWGVTDAALNEHHEQLEQPFSMVSVEKRRTEENVGTTKEVGDLISHDPIIRPLRL